jgi:AraC-binding-like domain
VTTILSTEGLSRHEREAFWRQAMSETFVPLTVGEVTEERFGGFIRSDWIGRLMVAEVASTAQDIRRTVREISRTDNEYFQIAMVYRGVGRVAQDGREAVLGPGDYAVYETTRPFRWTFDADWAVGTNVTSFVWLSRARKHPEKAPQVLPGIRALDTWLANPAAPGRP